jgi:hypothetical protein
MLVTSLEDMEKIIASRDDLRWEGWDVVKYTRSDNALYKKNGAFQDGKWMQKTVFPVTSDGWHLPNTIGRDYAQVEG